MSEHTTEPCPACREAGSDKSGNHLAIYPSRKFCCAAHPKDKAHNRRIVELRPDLGKADTFPPAESKRAISNPRASKSGKPGKIVAVYPYRDANGKLVYEIRRDDKKDFLPYLPGASMPGLNGVVRVPYRLPEVIKAESVWIVEGEKDADNLAALGYVATTRAGGSGKWDEELTPWFAGKDVIFCGDNDKPGRDYFPKVEAALSPVARSFRQVIVPAPAKDISEYLESGSDNDTEIEARAKVDALLSVPDPMDALLDARRFNLANPPAKPVAVLSINGKTIATAGNLVAVTSQAKAGKTALETAMMAALMEPTGDCLGITGQNPDGLPVLHFDTEQSPFDHHAVVLLTLRRAGREQPPEWLRSYCLADVATKDRRKAVAHEMKRAAIAGKLRAACIDGIADLCVDPNDPAEAFGLIEELHRLAITYDCPIVCLLHENPGSADTGKTRGHLGSQLERKAETNLRLSKDAGGITTVFSERSRHCHIPKDTGPRFAWDDIAGMHTSCASIKGEKDNAKEHETDGILAQVFTAAPLLSYTDLRGAIMRIRGITQRASEKYIASLQPKFIHQTASGLYGIKS
jgi:5S rRNA maturation endonuclease (ribonuclease M5)